MRRHATDRRTEGGKPVLYHWTSPTGRKGIGRRGLIRPHGFPWPHAHLVWLSDDPHATRLELGLTRNLVATDRMAHQYVVARHNAVPWLGSAAREAMDPAMRAEIERAPHCPEKWWISTQSVVGVLRMPRRRPRRGGAP